jgi:ribonuclease BN (tRNA processing enzyme)
MRLTVLGKSPSWQDVDGACSGYLLQDGETTVLVDCGNGVFAKLRKFVDYVDVDAVVISHLHADHFLDLVPYAYALTYAPRQQPVPVPPWPGTDNPARPRLIAPPGAEHAFRTIGGLFGNEQLIENAFTFEGYTEDSEPEVGDFRFCFHEVPHFTQTFAVRMQSNGSCLVYGADSSPNDELVEFADGCDLLLIEATLPRPERTGIRGHLTPMEAGEHARAAHAKQLVITHISDELDQVWARRQASEAFGSRAEVAREGAVFEI